VLPYGRKTPLPYPISQRSHVGNLRQTLKGKGRKSEGGNRRCLPSCAPARRQRTPCRGARRIPALRRAQLPAEVQRKTSRPSGTNTLTQFASPAQPVQKNAYAVCIPRSAGAEKTACAVRIPRLPYTAKTKKAPLTRCLSLLRICRLLSSSSCRNYRSRRRYYHHRYHRNRSRRCPDRSIPRSG